MLTKLEWEAESLDRHVSYGGNLSEATYWATNAAVTAWHIVDWVWADMSEAQRQVLGAKIGVTLSGNKGQERFEEYIARNRDLHICRAIALTAKHSVLQPKSAARFERVEAEVTLSTTMTLAGGLPPSNPYELIVKVDSAPENILTVLYRASSWWEGFVRTNDIASDY
jgi:hypothetical protein